MVVLKLRSGKSGLNSCSDPEKNDLADRLGSVRQIVDASGAVMDAVNYDSFGGILRESNPAEGDRFKFTGREYCPELGLYYYRARWYDPAVGRFISQDPIGFQAGDPNVYRYVGNAPGDAKDPKGLDAAISQNDVHSGIKLEIKNNLGHVVGILEADYAASNFINNRGAINEYIEVFQYVIGTPGQITIVFHPDQTINRKRFVKGSPEQDKKTAKVDP